MKTGCVKKPVSPFNSNDELRQAERCLYKTGIQTAKLLPAFIYLGRDKKVAVLVPRQVVQLLHLILSQNALWNGLRTWKTLRRLQSMSVFAY